MPLEKLKEKYDLSKGKEGATKTSIKMVQSYPGMYDFALSMADQGANYHDAQYSLLDVYGIEWDAMAIHFARCVTWLQTADGKKARGIEE